MRKCSLQVKSEKVKVKRGKKMRTRVEDLRGLINEVL